MVLFPLSIHELQVSRTNYVLRTIRLALLLTHSASEGTSEVLWIIPQWRLHLEQQCICFELLTFSYQLIGFDFQ